MQLGLFNGSCAYKNNCKQPPGINIPSAFSAISRWKLWKALKKDIKMSGRMKMSVEEDAAQLRFGEEFERTDAVRLWDTEVKLMLEKMKEHSSEQEGRNALLDEMHQYVEKFDRYKTKQAYQQAKAWVKKNFQQEVYLSELKDKEEHKNFLEQINKRKKDNQERRPEPGVKWKCGSGHENQATSPDCTVCMSKFNLDDFEVACISNLGISEAEEALLFIPTLRAKFPKETDLVDLRRLLDELELLFEQRGKFLYNPPDVKRLTTQNCLLRVVRPFGDFSQRVSG
eukprot:g6615.t1